jgi:hypothetical protein
VILVLASSLALGVQAASAQQTASAGVPQFAPGILTIIPPSVDRADVISIHDLAEIRSNPALKWEPYTTNVKRTLFEKAQEATFVLNVWCLEIAFKPLRMIEVDAFQADGARRKQVLYMVYRVRNTGAGITGEVKPDGSFTTVDEGTEPIRFLPQFVLVSHDRTAAGKPLGKAYLDRIVPAAMGPIQAREFSGRKLLNSVEMSEQELRIETGRTERGAWGVAMWEDVDPEIDFFSINVGGLTNAYRWDVPPGAFKQGDPPGKGRVFSRKVLQLNFWRPGDSIEQNEREIRYGVAPGKSDLYGVGEGVAYQWIYR